MKGISGESDNKKFNVVIKLVYKCTLEYHKQKLEKNIDSDSFHSPGILNVKKIERENVEFQISLLCLSLFGISIISTCYQ